MHVIASDAVRDAEAAAVRRGGDRRHRRGPRARRAGRGGRAAGQSARDAAARRRRAGHAGRRAVPVHAGLRSRHGLREAPARRRGRRSSTDPAARRPCAFRCRCRPAAAPSGRVVARAWAGRMVEELAVFPDRNEAAMAELGRRFGLVTPVTSLIVLETVQQYLEHQIEPPATWPEMRAAVPGRPRGSQGPGAPAAHGEDRSRARVVEGARLLVGARVPLRAGLPVEGAGRHRAWETGARGRWRAASWAEWRQKRQSSTPLAPPRRRQRARPPCRSRVDVKAADSEAESVAAVASSPSRRGRRTRRT